MRVAIAGIGHETVTFSPILTRMEDLHILRGQDIMTYRGLAGMLNSLGIEPVPILVAGSMAPSGFMEESTYLQLRQEMLDGFERAGHLDGICLVLHGAMLVENIWSGDADQVRCIRATVGNELPIAARLDLHATLTDEFANKTDTWAGFRTAPHRDTQETLERTLRLLVRSIREGLRPRPVFIRVPLLLQGEKSASDIDPLKSLIASATEVEKLPGILNAEVLVGNGWADAAHSGASVAVVAESVDYLPLAREHARRLAQSMWDRREAFTFDQEVAPSIDEAINRALSAPESTIFLSDSGDNPTAGAPGDTPCFLERLLAKGVPDAVLAGIPDLEATAACFEAGVGATVSFSLGGKMDTVHGEPVPVTGTVEHLYHPSEGVREAAMATLKVDGVRIIISSIRKAFTRLDHFRKAGIEPLEHKIVVVKLGYLFPELRDAAPREILALSPGYADMDLNRLPFRYVTRPIYPLDPDFEWRPVITNVAGYGG